MAINVILKGMEHTFRDKSAGFFPLQILSVENEFLSPPRHTHDFCELVYIRKGSTMHLHGKKRYPFHAGDCCFMTPGDPEGFSTQKNLCLTNVMFYPEIFGNYLNDFKKVPGFTRFFPVESLCLSETIFRHKLHLGASQQNRMQELLASLEAEFNRAAPGYRIACTALFFELVLFICRSFNADSTDTPEAEEFAGQEKAISEAISYLEKNFNQDIRIKDVANAANLSPAWLCTVFKEATGTSLIEYLTWFRIDSACKLLKEHSLSIKEIAYEVGFHDPAYFSRAFTKIQKVAPNVYRKKK